MTSSLATRPTVLIPAWLGLTLGQLGGQVLLLGVPLTAILALDATPMTLGWLSALDQLPGLLVGLPVSAWVLGRGRWVLPGLEVGRALVWAAVAVLALWHTLETGMLLVAALVSGALALVSDRVQTLKLAELFPPRHAPSAWLWLDAGSGLAWLLGPLLTGLLVEQLSGPVALGWGGAVLALGAVMWTLPPPGAPKPVPASGAVWAEVRRGWEVVRGHSLLRRMALMNFFHNGLFHARMALFFFFAVREVGLSPLALGLALAVGGVGLVVATLLEPMLSRLMGRGPLLGIAGGLEGICALLIPAAILWPGWGLAVLAVGEFLRGCAIILYNTEQAAIRQALAPEPLWERMSATFRFISFGATPFGAVLGGALGEGVGVIPTLVGVGVAAFIPAVLIWSSPLRSFREAGGQG